MNQPLGERLLNWLFHRRTKVREGGLFHELDHRRVADEAIDEVAERLEEKTRGYRNG